MTEIINRYLEMPLWLSIPLTLLYLGAVAYFVYTMYRYRNK